MARQVERLRGRLTQADRLLSTLKLSDEAILERGYALVTDAGGRLVRRAAEIAPGAELSLRFADGSAQVTADGEASPKPAARPARKPASAGSQGSLF